MLSGVPDGEGSTLQPPAETTTAAEDPRLPPQVWYQCRLKNDFETIQQRNVPLPIDVVAAIKNAMDRGEATFSHTTLHGVKQVSLNFEPYPNPKNLPSLSSAIVNADRTLMSYRCTWFFVNDECLIQPVELDQMAMYDSGYAACVEGGSNEIRFEKCKDRELGLYTRIVNVKELWSKNERTGKVRPLIRFDTSTGFVECADGATQCKMDIPYESSSILPFASAVKLLRDYYAFCRSGKPTNSCVATEGDLHRTSITDLKVDMSTVIPEPGVLKFNAMWKNKQTQPPVDQKVTLTYFLPLVFAMNKEGFFEAVDPNVASRLCNDLVKKSLSDDCAQNVDTALQQGYDFIYDYDLIKRKRKLQSGGSWLPLLVVQAR